MRFNVPRFNRVIYLQNPGAYEGESAESEDGWPIDDDVPANWGTKLGAHRRDANPVEELGDAQVVGVARTVFTIYYRADITEDSRFHDSETGLTFEMRGPPRLLGGDMPDSEHSTIRYLELHTKQVG